MQPRRVAYACLSPVAINAIGKRTKYRANVCLATPWLDGLLVAGICDFKSGGTSDMLAALSIAITRAALAVVHAQPEKPCIADPLQHANGGDAEILAG
jgi:hypothetical protein